MKKKHLSLKVPFLVLAIGCLAVPMFLAADALAQEKSSAPKTAPKSAARPAQSSLAGCVDQTDTGQFVLINEKTREKLTVLVAEGFAEEGFAKHLGQKVTVRGTASPDGSAPGFRVRSIEVISDACVAPQ
jgi:hypothetical protein